MNFDEVKEAVVILQTNPKLKKIDGNGWSVYVVGKIIRIDVKEKINEV
jgi:hypothetical protein